MSEKSFENKIKDYLKDRHHWHVKFFANRMTKKGVPDILACVNGYFLGIEVKDTGGRPSELQLWNREKIIDSNGICVIVYPHQFQQLKNLIWHLELDKPDQAREIAFEMSRR